MVGFVDTFPGTPVQTSPTSFRSVSLANNTTLTWPALVRNATNVIAKILEVTPTRSGRVLTLPGANEAATGEDALFYNKGGFSFTINNAVGGSVANVPSGAAVYLYLTDNSTVGGSWSVFTFWYRDLGCRRGCACWYGFGRIGERAQSDAAGATSNLRLHRYRCRSYQVLHL
jgi:hypothetical protein